MSAYYQAVHAAFPPDVCTRITTAVQQHPDPNGLAQLFQDIAHLKATTSQKTADVPANSKKRKLDDGVSAAQTNGTSSAVITNPTVSFECRDVSFQIPARKKLKLEVVADAQDQRRQEIRLRNQQNQEIGHTLSANSVEEAFCLPVPEKQARQWNFVLFPKVGAMTANAMPCEQVVFTMNETPPTGTSLSEHRLSEDETFVSVTMNVLDGLLIPHGKRVVRPNEAEFASSIPQSHRKGEKAYHVKAHRGSKEGYLFFLGNGIVFGFKKPLAYFPFSSVESVSYTSVLQRTFNLVIAARDNEEADIKEAEFSMLDQADFGGIDEYIKRHGLNDASMAADRRAKAFNVNKDKKAEANGDASPGDADGGSELQKAEQQLQDEDEEEEDYVESGGESDGEGEYSDDDDEEGYGDAGDEDGAEDAEHEEDAGDD